jgi:hypothetical protein
MAASRPAAIAIHDERDVVGNRLPITKTQSPQLCLSFGLLRATATKDGSYQRAQIPNSSLGHCYTTVPLRRLSVGMRSACARIFAAPSISLGSDLHDFTLFGLANPIHIFDILVGQFLQPIDAALEIVG